MYSEIPPKMSALLWKNHNIGTSGFTLGYTVKTVTQAFGNTAAAL